MRFRRPSDETIKILKLVALGVIIIGIGGVPSPRAMSRILRDLFSNESEDKSRWVKHRVYHMRKQGYIRKTSEGYALSPLGRKIVDEQRVWDLSVPAPKAWDGAWHLLAFDIPQKKSRVRIPFVRHLQNLGLIFYQRSVWVHPYPFSKEVQEIARFHGILPYISFITATQVDGSTHLQRKFKMKS